MNYPALHKHQVRLIVNLTESPVTSSGSPPCQKCALSINEVDFETDLFDELEEDHGMEVLFLPVKDGYIPTFEQIDIFLHCARETIDRGFKVMIHCHAGSNILTRRW